MQNIVKFVKGLEGTWLMVGIFLLLAIISYFIVRILLAKILHPILKRTKASWDDLLIEHKALRPFCFIPAVIILYQSARYLPAGTGFVQQLALAWTLILSILVCSRLLDVFHAVYETYPVSKRRPIKGYLQLAKIFLYGVGSIIAICVLLNKSPWGVLSGLGALTAVFMLVFKDTILSLVAGIQVVANDMVRKGDWIEILGSDISGNVEELALHTVKIRNFDKTISNVPIATLINQPFKNWRWMSEAGGRRIKRALFIDQSSIFFMTEETLNHLLNIEILAPYIVRCKEKIDKENAQNKADRDKSLLNGQGMTNIGLFRAYTLEYLNHHPNIHKQGMTLMVRQLPPESGKGLPLEIYCFSNNTDWVAYEQIQSDIMDHLLAALPEFGLRAYQRNALADDRTK